MSLTTVVETDHSKLIAFAINSLKSHKWLCICIILVFSVSSVFFALSIPNTYRSVAVLTPTDSSGGGSLSGLMGQLGALSSIAGVNIGGAQGKKHFLIEEELKSRDFLIPFIDKHELKPMLFGANGWNKLDNIILYDEKIYNNKSQKWQREVEPPKSIVPSSEESYKKFREILKVTFDRKKNLFKVSIDFYSPFVAQSILNALITDYNQYSKSKNTIEIVKNIEFLEARIESSEITEMKSSLYELLEEQLKALMLAESKENYAFELIQKPYIPEEKEGPKRAFICIAITFLGMIFAVLSALVLAFYKRK